MDQRTHTMVTHQVDALARLLLGYALLVLLFTGCSSGPNLSLQTPTPASPALTLVKPAAFVPGTCTPTPVYVGPHGGNRLAIPWLAATPSTSGIVAYLFFTRVEPANKPTSYLPMHTGGRMPDGGTTKILWQIQNRGAIGQITITGKNLFRPSSTFQQTFGEASNGIPSIVDVPTAGCWRFDLQSGSDRGTALLWVLP
jgi:hypothetical protein